MSPAHPRKCRGAVLILSLWVLAIAVLLVISLAGQAGLSIDSAREGIRQQQFEEWMKAGVRRAAYEIFYQEPMTQEDPLSSRLSYRWSEEEGRININTASKELLMLLPGIDSLAAEKIIQWRETVNGFHAPQELLLANRMNPEQWEAIAGLITIHGLGAVAVNGTDIEVLRRILQWVMAPMPLDDQARAAGAEALANKILSFRRGADAEFGTADDRRFLRRNNLEAELQDAGIYLTQQEIGVIDALEPHLTTEASFWRVEVTVSDDTLERTAEAIFRVVSPMKIEYVFWMERS